jgi:hypothetical protein
MHFSVGLKIIKSPREGTARNMALGKGGGSTVTTVTTVTIKICSGRIK